MDLGAFDPTIKDAGVAAWLDRASHVPSWIVVMEDRQPDFFHDYKGFDPSAPVPLNRHGPFKHEWTMGDLKRLVDAFHAHGVKVLYGYWIHECRFVDVEHPELLIRDATGQLWQDTDEMNADFSPLRRMKADPARGIAEGERYAAWSGRRYAQLAADFGFDGLFLGDGGMGFRRHGKDWKDLRHFDYHEEWLAEFRVDATCSRHDGCALWKDDATTPERAADIHHHHWEEWVEWNTARWTRYYADMAQAVHKTGGLLAAYNCMNYDPAIARLHGVDYRGIAEAGLDIMVFQAYDYAWGPLGPFGFLHITRKDLATNLQALLRVRAHVGYHTKLQIVLSVETEDEVEGWDAPVSHTLGELHAMGAAVAHDRGAWRRALDGAFIVWGNSVDSSEWRLVATACHYLAAEPATPSSAQVWSEGEIHRLVSQGVPTSQEPEMLYAHLDVAPTKGDGPATGAIIRAEDAVSAPFAKRVSSAAARWRQPVQP